MKGLPKLTDEESLICVEGYQDALNGKLPRRREPAYLLGYRNGRNDRKGPGKHNHYDRIRFFNELKSRDDG